MAMVNDSASPAYPAPKEASPEEREAVLGEYRDLAGSVRAGIEGLTREQLLAVPVPGTWSLHQIVLHLADAELVFAERFKRMIADAEPELAAFDENRWMEHLAVAERPAPQAAALLELVRLDVAAVLDTLPVERLMRKGRHSQMGEISLLAHVKRGNWHLRHHLKFIHQKRRMVMRVGAGVGAGKVY